MPGPWGRRGGSPALPLVNKKVLISAHLEVTKIQVWSIIPTLGPEGRNPGTNTSELRILSDQTGNVPSLANLWEQALPRPTVPGLALISGLPSGQQQQQFISLGADELLEPAKSPSWEFPGSGF